LNERPMMMERTGGLEPPFSAPFTDHRFEAGVGYVRVFRRQRATNKFGGEPG